MPAFKQDEVKALIGAAESLLAGRGANEIRGTPYGSLYLGNLSTLNSPVTPEMLAKAVIQSPEHMQCTVAYLPLQVLQPNAQVLLQVNAEDDIGRHVYCVAMTAFADAQRRADRRVTFSYESATGGKVFVDNLPAHVLVWEADYGVDGHMQGAWIYGYCNIRPRPNKAKKRTKSGARLASHLADATERAKNLLEVCVRTLPFLPFFYLCACTHTCSPKARTSVARTWPGSSLPSGAKSAKRCCRTKAAKARATRKTKKKKKRKTPRRRTHGATASTPWARTSGSRAW